MEGLLLFIKEVGALWKCVLLVQCGFTLIIFTGTGLKIAHYNNVINKLKFFPKTSENTIYTSE